MELGESDLARIIRIKLDPADAKLDMSFTRYYWKEMLECVDAVHEHDIVHSDLKYVLSTQPSTLPTAPILTPILLDPQTSSLYPAA
jgi:serine/threonine protein kinase